MLDAIKSNKLVFIIGGILVAIILAGLLAFLALQSGNDQKTPTLSPSTQAQQPTQAPVAAPTTTVSDETTDDFAALVDESLLTQPVETDPALLKDELVQLNDIQAQLNEQKELLEQQHQDSDKLIELKEKQLLALEKQLEATQIQ